MEKIRTFNIPFIVLIITYTALLFFAISDWGEEEPRINLEQEFGITKSPSADTLYIELLDAEYSKDETILTLKFTIKKEMFNFAGTDDN